MRIDTRWLSTNGAYETRRDGQGNPIPWGNEIPPIWAIDLTKKDRVSQTFRKIVAPEVVSRPLDREGNGDLLMRREWNYTRSIGLIKITMQ